MLLTLGMGIWKTRDALRNAHLIARHVTTLTTRDSKSCT